MNSSFIAAKLCRPILNPEIVHRPRLIDLLGKALNHKLILISAPAGYGKTTLVSDFFTARDSLTAWLSLDKDDNDPVRFWSYFISALQTIQPEIGKLTLQIPATSGTTPAKTALTALIREITNKTNELENRCTLILDQYDLIDNQSIHEGMMFLIDNLPPKLQILIISRVEPPFTLSRLRANGHIFEIRTEDLRFNRQEITEFVNDLMKIGMFENDISVLETRTEGWIASLRLFALSVKNRENEVSDFIKEFGGSNRHILDYLTEEVLNQQPDEIRTFLLQTSILEQLNESLCSFVTKNKNSQEILTSLDNSNLFIVPLDSERKWYRYHYLFAEILRHKLSKIEPNLIPTLHRRASQWFEQNAYPVEAVSHSLLSGGDLDHTATLIENVAESLLTRGEMITLQNWIQSMPETVVSSQPLLCVFHALSLLYTGGSIKLIESRISQAESDSCGDTIFGAITAIRAYIAMLQGDARLSIELSNEALKRLPNDNSLMQLHITGFLGRMHMMNGNVLAANQSLQRVAVIAEKTSNLFLNVRALNRLAELHIMQGQLQEAKSYYDQILRISVDEEGEPLPIAGISYMGLGELSREKTQLDDACLYLGKGIELTKKYSEIRAINGYVALARTNQAQENFDSASELIQKAILLAEEYDIDKIKEAYILQRQARLWILQNKIELALEWTQNNAPGKYSSYGLEIDENIKIPQYYLVYEFGQITLARIRIGQGMHQEALHLLYPLVEKAETQKRKGSLIEILNLQAVAYYSMGNEANALDALRLSLSLAKTSGYIRTFIDERKPMYNLLQLAYSKRIELNYVTELLAAFSSKTSKPSESEVKNSSSSADVNNLLSLREKEVFNLIEKGYSNKKIAETLYLTLGTIKKHKHNISRKLNMPKPLRIDFGADASES